MGHGWRRPRTGDRPHCAHRHGSGIATRRLAEDRVIRLGLALDATEIVAAHGDQLWSRAIDGDDLAALLAELARHLERGRSQVAASVALMPPLVQTRRLAFPRLGPRELRRVLSRDAAKYFPRCREPQVANGSPIAAGAPAATVDAIVAAV